MKSEKEKKKETYKRTQKPNKPKQAKRACKPLFSKHSFSLYECKAFAPAGNETDQD